LTNSQIDVSYSMTKSTKLRIGDRVEVARIENNLGLDMPSYKGNIIKISTDPSLMFLVLADDPLIQDRWYGPALIKEI